MWRTRELSGGRNERGSRVSPGVYFVRATDGTAVKQRRVTVLR